MSMRRREFILGIAMIANVGASAQDRGRRIGVLTTGGPAIIPGPNNMFETILKEKGWIVGGNLQIEYRITGGDTNLSRAYARELIAIQPDVLVAVTNTSMAALHAEHSNIPTVFAMVSDPVGMHYVESFSRPGGNATGFGASFITTCSNALEGSATRICAAGVFSEKSSGTKTAAARVLRNLGMYFGLL